MDLNKKTILHIAGILFIITGFAMLLPLMVALFYGEIDCIKAFSLVLIPSFILGILITKTIRPSKKQLKLRDGYIIVSLSWLLLSAISAFPYVIQGCIPNFIDAFFETCSGYSTTGSSILTDVEALPKSMTFWRLFAHWIGGMGILVFAVALLPALGISGQTIVKAETPGPMLSKITPKMSDTARALYSIYLGFTLLETLLLMLGGLSLFDALVHSFATVGTGGFSSYNSSIAAFDSAYVEWIIALFMILSGVNFNLYFLSLKGGIKSLIQDAEFKLYLFIIAASTLLITLSLYFTNTFGSVLTAFRYATFQCASIITTTGFATNDFNLWPTFCTMILFCLFFVGGCSSSTGGGIKAIRILVLLKQIKRTIALRLHPNAMVTIKIGNRRLPSDTVQGISSFFFLYLFTLFTVSILVSLDGYDVVTSFSATASCLGNIGPGFNQVGPTMNFSIFSPPIKLLLSLTMIIGRLELFTFFMLFSRKFWNPNH
ncbi:MAG: potassium transporter TrkG [Anaerovoracaceae bacterium]